jgi:hypothetical protein
VTTVPPARPGAPAPGSARHGGSILRAAGREGGEIADLFLDPDEDGLHDAQIGSKLLNQMSV